MQNSHCLLGLVLFVPDEVQPLAAGSVECGLTVASLAAINPPRELFVLATHCHNHNIPSIFRAFT